MGPGQPSEPVRLSPHRPGQGHDAGEHAFHPDQVGSGLLVAVIGAAIIVGSGAATAIAHALVMILITAAVVIALTIGGGITYLGAQSRTGQPDTGLMTVERLAARRAEALGEQPARPQLETGDRHFPACPLRGVSPQASGRAGTRPARRMGAPEARPRRGASDPRDYSPGWRGVRMILSQAAGTWRTVHSPSRVQRRPSDPVIVGNSHTWVSRSRGTSDGIT